MTTTVDIDELHHRDLWSTPRWIDWDTARNTRWTEATHFTDDQGRRHLLVVSGKRVTSLVADGDFYAANDYPAYARNRPGTLTRAEFEALFALTLPSHLCQGPQMNYWYPCNFGDRDLTAAQVAAKLVGVALCVVEFEDTTDPTGLALTGGGMDMTWDIVAAFVALGQLPPVHFARDLPGMAGRGKSETDRLLIAACLRSLDAGAEIMAHEASRLREQAGRWLNRG